MKKDTMPMKAVELMVSIDFKNRCATDRMIYNMDLHEIDERKIGLKDLNNAADLMTIYCDKQLDIGIKAVWIEDALGVINDYTEIEAARLNKEEKDIKSRLETLDKQVKEFDKKDKKRKKNAKKS